MPHISRFDAGLENLHTAFDIGVDIRQTPPDNSLEVCDIVFLDAAVFVLWVQKRLLVSRKVVIGEDRP